MKTLVALLFTAYAGLAQAGWQTLTIDFNHPITWASPGYVTQGFKFTAPPLCGYGYWEDTWPAYAPTDGTWLGMGICDHGSPPPQINIKHQYGHPFTFISFDSPYGMGVIASSGARANWSPDYANSDYTPPTDPEYDPIWNFTANFAGPEWANLSWVTLCVWSGCLGEGDVHDHGVFDNVRVVYYVPEPAPLTLIAVALAGLAFTRRRKQ